MGRVKKLTVGLHDVLLIERDAPSGSDRQDYYVHLAGRGGLDVSHGELARLLVELNRFKNGGATDADEL